LPPLPFLPGCGRIGEAQGTEAEPGPDEPLPDVAAGRNAAQRSGHGKNMMLIHSVPSVKTPIVIGGTRRSARHPSSGCHVVAGII
jgi:hypothetical protein